jgi:hypothetical protein
VLFDDENLVSFAGLVPVMALAEQAGLSELITERVAITTTRVKSAGVNPAGKLTSIIAGMAAGADSIDDLDVIRSGGIPRLFGGVYACATLGQFLREFTHGHTRQLASVARGHLVNLVENSGLLAGIEAQTFIDIDSLLRPVYGHTKGPITVDGGSRECSAVELGSRGGTAVGESDRSPARARRAMDRQFAAGRGPLLLRMATPGKDAPVATRRDSARWTGAPEGAWLVALDLRGGRRWLGAVA